MAREAKVEIFMPVYLADYDRDTAHLDFEEHGFYWAVLRALWACNGVLPMDRGQLARVLRTNTKTIGRLWPQISGFLTVSSDGETFIQSRLSRELDKAIAKRKAAVSSGKLGAKARYEKDGHGDPNSGAMATPAAAPWLPQQHETWRPQQPNDTSSPSPSDPPLDLDPIPSQASGSDARDPGATGAPRHQPNGLPPHLARRFLTTYLPPSAYLTQIFGHVRSEVIGGSMEWHTPKHGPEKTGDLALLIQERGAEGDVEPTMRLFWEKAKSDELDDARKIRDNTTFAFGCWRSVFGNLRDELHSAPPRKRARAAERQYHEIPD